MKRLVRAAVLWLAASVATAAPPPITAPPNPGITVLSGEFGTLGAKRKLDIVLPLQKLCGGGESCSVFCSETSFGLYRLGRKPICRVVYRCPDNSARSVEAAREEPILLRCEDHEVEQSAWTATSIDELQPPPYIPPQSDR